MVAALQLIGVVRRVQSPFLQGRWLASFVPVFRAAVGSEAECSGVRGKQLPDLAKLSHCPFTVTWTLCYYLCYQVLSGFVAMSRHWASYRN